MISTYRKLTKWTIIILILFYATSLWGSIGNVDQIEGNGVIDRDKTDITIESSTSSNAVTETFTVTEFPDDGFWISFRIYSTGN